MRFHNITSPFNYTLADLKINKLPTFAAYFFLFFFFFSLHYNILETKHGLIVVVTLPRVYNAREKRKQFNVITHFNYVQVIVRQGPYT